MRGEIGPAASVNCLQGRESVGQQPAPSLPHGGCGGCTPLPLPGFWGAHNLVSISNRDTPHVCSLVLSAPSGVTAMPCAGTGCPFTIPTKDAEQSRQPGEAGELMLPITALLQEKSPCTARLLL